MIRVVGRSFRLGVQGGHRIKSTELVDGTGSLMGICLDGCISEALLDRGCCVYDA